MDATQVKESNYLDLNKLENHAGLDKFLPEKSIRRMVVLYSITAFLSLFGAIVVLNLWDLSLIRYPFQFKDDSVLMAMLTKTVIETGWYLSNPQIGVPGGFQLVDFPFVDGLNFVFIKFISIFSENWALVNNIFYLLTYPLCSMTAFFVLRNFGLWAPFSITASVLFSLLPYHFHRGEAHLFLSAYYMIPLAVWLAIIVFKNEVFQSENKKNSIRKKYTHLLVYGSICLVIGSIGVYYAFYSVFFLLISGVIASLKVKNLRPLKPAALFIGLISTAVILNALPSILNRYQNEPNPVVGKRYMRESEVYGLKISQLLLPVKNDRIKAFSCMTKKYNHSGVKVNENRFASLGLIGSVGFVSLLFFSLVRKKKEERDQNDSPMEALSCLNLCGVLFATTGGFSALFALLVTPSIRSHNRMSVFLAFFSLAAFFFIFQRLLQKSIKQNVRQVAWGSGMILLVFGIWNQTSPSFSLKNQKYNIKQQFDQGKKFIQKVDQALPENSMIFQLPYIPFPEGGKEGKFGDYDHFKAVLHSRSQRWSFGAMNGRETAKWQKSVAALPCLKMLEQLVRKGFKGLYINRMGYHDHAQAIETELSKIINSRPIESEDGNELFWDLQTFAKKLESEK